MSITFNLYYKGKNNNALLFAKEMEESGIADKIRSSKGNLKYEYFVPLNSSDTVLLIDSWQDEAALRLHHEGPLMKEIALLREKYDLHMTAKRFTEEEIKKDNEEYIKK